MRAVTSQSCPTKVSSIAVPKVIIGKRFQMCWLMTFVRIWG